MATAGNNRDTVLRVGIEVEGKDALQGLGRDVQSVGDAAGASASDIARFTAELEQQRTATAALRQAEQAATREQAAARAELDSKRDALARARAEATAGTRATTEYQAAEIAAKVSIVEARIELRAKTQAAQAAAAESRASVAAENELTASLQRATVAQRAAAAATREQASAGTEALASIKGQLDALRNLAGLALGGSLIGSLGKDLADTADGYANLAARVKIATGEGAQFSTAFQGVFDVAQRTGTSVEDVGALFTKLVQAGKELNLTSADALRLAESVSQATQLSGASAQEAASAVTQFSQAIASGRLQGDELRSLLENSPRLARALSDGLGVTIGQLRDLGAAGSLTSQQVIAALQGQSAALQREFETLPLTVGRSLTNLSTAWTAYIGQADGATGASHTAAAAIELLSRNLGTVATVLFDAGKAAAAWQALRLAQTFLDIGTATKAATVATAANTAALAANAVAGEAAVSVGSRLATAFATLRAFSYVAILANVKDLGTAAGEWIAKMAGAGKGLADLEAATKADEAASRAASAAKAEYAQKLAQASDKALGLTKESRVLIAEFDGLREKGESAAEALGKLAKSLRLEDVSGIKNAGTALDALAERGKITAQQVREALAAALKGDDLLVFETNARAAFDKSEQGARRLRAALDAITDESLRRAGTSVQELKTGFSKAADSAINDLDLVARSLTELGIKGDDAGRVLTKAIDQAVAAAGTERAVRDVVARVEELGKAGKLTGDALESALTRARAKADDLASGVNSLDEALRLFGLKSKAELTTTADRLGQAYTTISASANVSLQSQIEAFVKWRDAAVAAGKNVEGGQVAIAQRTLEIRAGAAGMGEALQSALDKGTAAAGKTRAALQDVAGAAQEAIDLTERATTTRNATVTTGKAAGSLGALIQSTPSGGTTRTEATGQVQFPDNSGLWIATSDPRGARSYAVDSRGNSIPGVYVTLPESNKAAYSAWLAAQKTAQPTAPATPIAADPGTVSTPTSTSTLQPVTINLAGSRSVTVTAANSADAAALVSLLQEAVARAGGGQ